VSISTANIPVPVAGDGPIVDVSVLVGQKTVVLSGRFAGTYDLLGSHDDATFTPILQFNAGGTESIRQTVTGAFKSFRLRSSATALGAVTCEVAAIAGAGNNQFLVVGNLPAGFQGYSPIVDTAATFPPAGAEVDICFICLGSFTGQVVLLGSIDGVGWNAIGSFRADTVPEGSPPTALEFSVLPTDDKVRYLRLHVSDLDDVSGSVVVTMGGGRYPGGGGPVGADSISPVDEATGRATSIGAAGEEILYEEPMDLDAIAAGAPIAPQWSIVCSVTGGNGTFRLYVGATTPGDTAGGTVRLVLATASVAKVRGSGAGAAFLNPGGKVLVQVTGQNDDPSNQVSRMYSFSLRMV
jgi:hypothetical protein